MSLDFTAIIQVFIVACFANLPAIILAWKNKTSLDLAKKDIAAIHTATNSMKDALVQATAKASLAEGHAQGVSDEQARQGGK
jgi:hypothetical protein